MIFPMKPHTNNTSASPGSSTPEDAQAKKFWITFIAGIALQAAIVIVGMYVSQAKQEITFQFFQRTFDEYKASQAAIINEIIKDQCRMDDRVRSLEINTHH